ncbi:lipoprotein [Spiroplasma endosymbiont of Cantharis lateralis]|uniref:lipoprotein n=1 Tax=Spiroplasma endosymbiont of Cantharis lateralis TaxID=3066277 RepID=UPI00313BD301
MKKLLNILTSVTLIGSAATSVAACGNGGGKTDPVISDLQKEMLKGAEFISRLIVAGRHENLNYNVNEILSIFLTPTPTAMNMPVSYRYNDQSINMATNINRFRNYLAPSLNYYNGDNYAGMFASYVMGMYDDEFYDEIINGDEDSYYFRDTFSKVGNQGYNKKGNNAMGYAAGLGKDINLSKNEERRNLAWGIQDTGALSNYLLNLGFDGANPTDTNGTSSPKTNAKPMFGDSDAVGTNGSGYAWYNSILMKGSATRSLDYGNPALKPSLKTGINIKKGKMKNNESYKPANEDLKSFINDMEFNSTGALITKVAGEQNINGFISLFGSMLENISETKNGALILSEFMNVLFPMITGGGVSSTQSIMQKVGMSLITNVWDGIKKIDKSLVTEEIFEKIENNIDEVPGGLFSISKVENFYKVAPKDAIKQGTNAKNIIEIIESLTDMYKNAENKEAFNNKFFIENNSPFYKSYSSIMEYIGEENWIKSIKGENQNGGINLLNFAKGAFTMFTNTDIIEKFELIINEFSDVDTFRDLTNLQKNKFLELIGWSEKGYEDGSLGARLYNAFTNKQVLGQKDFADFFAAFKDSVAVAMRAVHEPVLQYIVDDKYWRVNNFKISTTSNTQLSGKMEFNLDYSGNGDVTSNASQQTKKVEVGEKFNPYQTLEIHQKDEIKKLKELDKLDEEKINNSGKILGLEQKIIDEKNLASYDGRGNWQDYKPVKNSYKIVWENISKNQESPYWVITSLRSFNANGEEFYNIY